MNTIKQRPFAFSCFLFVISAVLLFTASPWIKFAFAFLVLLTVIFLFSNRKKHAFCVSRFSYDGYRIGEKGKLTYKGNKLLSFQ